MAGEFDATSLVGSSASGTVTDAGVTGVFTFARTASNGYAGVSFADGASGIQAENLRDETVLPNPDSFNYTFTVTPPTGYNAEITILQAAYARFGNSEAANRTLTWTGGAAIVSDPSGATRGDAGSVDFPPYNPTLNPDCSAYTENQIEGFATGDPLTPGTTFVSASVDNVNAEWRIALPSGVTSVDISNETLVTNQRPAITEDNTCNFAFSVVRGNPVPGEAFREWISVDVAFVVQPTPIEASNDAPAAIISANGGTLPNVTANDSFNGVTGPAIGTDVTLATTGTAQDATTTLGLDTTPAEGGITLDAGTGDITVSPGTTPGTYIYTYEICDAADTTNCDIAEVTVVVGATIDVPAATPVPALGGRFLAILVVLLGFAGSRFSRRPS